MGIFDFITKKSTTAGDTFVPEPQTLEVIPQDPMQFIYPVLNDYRKGMWVKTAGHRIGILARFADSCYAEVALTDALGLNIATEEHQITHLVRAKISEIPEARINHLSRNDLRALGYED